MDKLIDQCLIQFKKERAINDVFGIPKRLPLIDSFASQNRLDKKIFHKKNVLFIQHCLAPIVKRIDAMKKYGKLNPDNCWFVDIPYSTSKEIKNKIQKKYPKMKFATEFTDPLKPYKKAQRLRLIQTLEQIADTKGDLLIIDDGAYTIRTLTKLGDDNDLVKKICNRKISIVEQTTRGHRYFTEKPNSKKYKIFLINHNISVVSIAKTQTKIHLESPFIGAAVSSRMVKSIKNFNGKKKKKLGRVLVLGFGSVGKATTKEISKRRLAKEIDVSEKDTSLTSEIKKIKKVKNVLPPLNSPSFNSDLKYDAIIGCTGYSSFKPENVDILNDHAVLASGSSATVEFNRVKFLEKLQNTKHGFKLVNKKQIIKDDDIHSPITLLKENKSFTFLNAGYPVNFDGSTESQPYWTIQMTHCLLIAASQEALKLTKQKKFGFKELNPDDDSWIFQNSLKHLKRYLKKQDVDKKYLLRKK